MKKGFTLLEIMISSVIIAMAVIPVWDMISGANKSMASIEEESLGMALASEGLEWIGSLSYRELLAFRTLPDTSRLGQVSSGSDSRGAYVSYTRKLQSMELDGGKILEYSPEEKFSDYIRNIQIYTPANDPLRTIYCLIEVSWTSRLRGNAKSSVYLDLSRSDLE